MNKNILSLSALALSLSVSQATLACSSDHHSNFWGERVHKMVSHLDLSAEQKGKIHTIRERAKHEMQAKFNELRTLRHDKNEILAAPTFNESKLDGVINQEKDVLGSILKIAAMERHEISNVLTAKQKEKLSEMVQKWEKKQHEDKED